MPEAGIRYKGHGLTAYSSAEPEGREGGAASDSPVQCIQQVVGQYAQGACAFKVDAIVIVVAAAFTTPSVIVVGTSQSVYAWQHA
jgi:hypothetical protein